uniref:Elongation of very long chain fatty acids protein n=1 Tax=Paracyclopina nana TaxID=565004 RepID=A0A1L3THV7_PARNA|nr:elongase1 [Paracyclopina nana]
MLDFLMGKYGDYRAIADYVWDQRDKRVDGWFMMNSFWPTFLTCSAYVYIVKVAGPRFMKDRKPYNINTFLVYYNALQVVLSTYLFVNLCRAGWLSDYSFRCQPVDYSDSPKALLMLHCCYIYYLSKFLEFIDTFCFVARKKFNQVSLLHVVHHGIMPMSVWPGARYVPGGHASFFGLLNVFVHMFMYFYYMLAAMGPKYQKYTWWKRHMTNLQMIQFVGIMVHGFQLVFYDDCDFPWQFSYYIGAHAVLFFVLFSEFYINNYLGKKPRPPVTDANGHAKKNGTSANGVGHTGKTEEESNGKIKAA